MARLDDAKPSGAATSAGRCEARIGPQRAHERWHVTSYSVSSSSATKEPECRIYLRSESPSNLIDGTYAGKRDSNPSTDWRLEPGEQLVAVWTNADVGSIGTFSVRGEMTYGVQ